MAPNTTLVMQTTNHHGITKNDRRASKPLMEKRRRERINKSLNELKSILLEALRKDSTCHSKLEKADILEMTVRYLRGIQRQRLTTAMAIDPSIANKYRTGYVECKTEVTKYLEHSGESIHPDVKSRLISHLGNAAMTHPAVMGHPQFMTAGPPVSVGSPNQPLQIQMAQNSQMHALAAAAAALSGNNNGYMMKGPNHYEHQFQTSPSASPIQHVRHHSGSSVESDCSISPNDQRLQAQFLVLPNTQCRTPSPAASHRSSPYSRQSISPASSVSSHNGNIQVVPSPFVTVSKSSLSSSSDPVWRPW